MKSSLQQLFEQLELLYENTYNLLSGFQEASRTALDKISVPIKNADGTITNVEINSFQQLHTEMSRIDANFKSLLNADNISYVLNGDGSISQTTKTSFINAEYLSQFKIDSNCIIDKTSIIGNLVFPNVKIPITVDSSLRSDIRCFAYNVTDGWDKIPEECTMVNMEYLIERGDVIAEEYQHVLGLEKEQVKYFGKFTITNCNQIDSENWKLVLSGVQYQSLNSIGISIDLKVGDLMATKNGSAKFEIKEINKFKKEITIRRVAGTDIPRVGIDNLLFNEILPSDTNIVGVPVKPMQKLIIFLSTENHKNISYPSIGIKLDSSTYTVIFNDITYTLDDYFSEFVVNFGEYLQSLLNETSIPVTLGITPQKPKLDVANFKVIQINKHLTTAKSTEELNKLNEDKQKIKNDIETKQSSIDSLQNEIDTLKFKTVEEKEYRLNKIKKFRSEITTLNQNLLVVSRNLDSNAVNYGLKDFKPKYRVIGFWNIQEPMFSPKTKPQNLIKYDVQYRYLSKNVDTIDNTSMKMISQGKEINVVFSSWVDLPTKTLNKVEDLSGKLVWETPVMDSVDDININQCMVSIRDGESVEVRVRAVSEAGYPISPIKSEWSDIMRVDFPSDVSNSAVSSIVSKNQNDLLSAEFNQILASAGLLSHISGQIKESEKTFFHAAKDIASGLYTAEQKNISLDTVIFDLKKSIDTLMNVGKTEQITVEVVDFNNDNFVIRNNQTLELFAGNYSDNLNLLDKEKYGSIIRKQGFVKIKNGNNLPIEIKTLVPGNNFDSSNAPLYYNVPVRNQDKLIQSSKQIVYYRSIDLTGQDEDIFRLVKPKSAYPDGTVTVPSADIDTSASEDKKNVIYLGSDGIVKRCKLMEQHKTNYNCFVMGHPLYDADDTTQMINELTRLKGYTSILKEPQSQLEATINDVSGRCGFNDNDMYAIGQNTCGAFLYPLIVNPQNISVVGSTTTATLIVAANSEILIPFIFEYRMVDRLGLIDGVVNNAISSDIAYQKKIGIDMLINNAQFKFDISVTAKLKSKIAPVDSQNVSSVIGAFKEENKQVII